MLLILEVVEHHGHFVSIYLRETGVSRFEMKRVIGDIFIIQIR